MQRCLISFGANLGDALATIQEAARDLQGLLSCPATDFKLSRFYRTPPVGGPPGQPPFVNAVVALSTMRSPWEVWQSVREVEQRFGRRRVRRWEARPIDLDILLYEDFRLWTPQLKIPHPRMCMRRFILEPAMDVAAEWIDPVSQWTVRRLAERLRANTANLLLFGDPSSQLMLEEVARGAVANWCTFHAQGPSCFSTAESTVQGRWVGWLPLAGLDELVGQIEIRPAPKLLMFLANNHRECAAQWEDIHLGLAQRMRLTNHPGQDMEWSLEGARYLLSAESRQWAVHEMIAALEAMDCPVEVLE